MSDEPEIVDDVTVAALAQNDQDIMCARHQAEATAEFYLRLRDKKVPASSAERLTRQWFENYYGFGDDDD